MFRLAHDTERIPFHDLPLHAKGVDDVIDCHSFLLNSNVEVTGAARLYRAADGWTAGLADVSTRLGMRSRKKLLK